MDWTQSTARGKDIGSRRPLEKDQNNVVYVQLGSGSLRLYGSLSDRSSFPGNVKILRPLSSTFYVNKPIVFHEICLKSLENYNEISLTFTWQH